MDPVPPTSLPSVSPTPPIEPQPKSKLWMWIVAGISLLGIGIVAGIFLGKQLYSIPQPQPIPTPSPSEASAKEGDPTANWKTSNNIILGASFRYPNDWVISETETYTSVVKNPVTATVVDACPGYSLLVSKYDPSTNYARANKIIKGELDGQTTEVWENINKCSEVMVFVNQRPTNNIKPKYVISFTSADSTNSKRVFDQILSTFQFTNR